MVKAGAGQAADQFHARFMAGLKTGAFSRSSLPTPARAASLGLRRTRAGTRNCSRILMLASEALGAHD